MQFLTTVLYFIITLGVLVLVHELGHFLAAKLFGMRVDRFSIGFPPRAFGKKIGETDYCVSWIPIGGYVKIAGMIDESFDTDFLSKPPEPWEFRAKPVWQRIIVICAGVLMNLVLATVIFWGINYVQGSVVRETTTIGYVAENSPAAKAGLQAGDKVLEINGKQVRNWDQIYSDVYIESLGNDVHFVVERAGARKEFDLPRTAIPEPDQVSLGIVPENTEIVVQTVEPGKPADLLGLKPNDVLLAMNGAPVRLDQKVRETVEASAGKPLEVEWRRDGTVMHGTTVPTLEGRIGITFGARYNGPVTRIRYTLLEALPRGVREIGNVTVLFVQQIWQIITGKTPFSQSVGGPIRIAQMATQTAEMGLPTYLGFMALLSVSLAVLNILPFPALDGGHLAFLIYEGIFRREVPIRVKLGLQRAGFVLLLAFMAFVMYNDLVHF
ncbi:MAG TPA: RIP metalloprotease RseP [Bacteroidota bacterium]